VLQCRLPYSPKLPRWKRAVCDLHETNVAKVDASRIIAEASPVADVEAEGVGNVATVSER
jgi:hypothetical protein